MFVDYCSAFLWYSFGGFLFMQLTKVTSFEKMIKAFFSFVFVFPFLEFLRKKVMEDLKGEIAAKYRKLICSLDLREVARGFTFHDFPLMNPTIIDDLK